MAVFASLTASVVAIGANRKLFEETIEEREEQTDKDGKTTTKTKKTLRSNFFLKLLQNMSFFQL